MSRAVCWLIFAGRHAVGAPTPAQGTSNDDGSSPSPSVFPSPGTSNDDGSSPSPSVFPSPDSSSPSPSPAGLGLSQQTMRTITNEVLTPEAQAILAAGKAIYCPLHCKKYHAGASRDMPFVAQPLPSGVGDLSGNVNSSRGVAANCYPPYGVGPPYTEDWKVCLQQGLPIPLPGASKEALRESICRTTIDSLAGKDFSHLPTDGAMGDRSTSEVTEARWMKTKGDIECGWGSTLASVAPEEVGSYDDWLRNYGYHVSDFTSASSFGGRAIEDDFDCCLFAMSFDGTPWQEGGATVRFQFSSQHGCRVNRETMVRGNLDRSGGLALRDTHPCGDGWMYWRHATGAADAANLKGETPCEKEGGFEVLKGSDGALLPVGSLPDHFTSQWGNEFPNHACANWPFGGCKGVIGYNTISAPEECCEACATLKWVEEQGGDVSKVERIDEATNQTKMVFANPCVAWQVVGGKCRIMREQMVREFFPGKTVREAILQGGSCQEGESGEGNCNYYSFARFRETFEAPTLAPSPTRASTPSPTPASSEEPPLIEDDAASFVKMALMDLFAGRTADQYLQEAAAGGHMSLDMSAAITTLVGQGGSKQMQEWLDLAQGEVVEFDSSENITCAKIQLYSSVDLTNFADGSVSLPTGSAAPRPWCDSEVCVSGGVLHLHCNVTEFALQLPMEGRRLSGGEGPKAVMVFGSAGTGKDESVFEDIVVTMTQDSFEPFPVPSPVPSPEDPALTAASVGKPRLTHAVGMLLGVTALALAS